MMLNRLRPARFGLSPMLGPNRLFSGTPSLYKFVAGVESVDLTRRPDAPSKPWKSRLKKQYLRKFPPVRKDREGNIQVEGVSNKSMPCPIPWIEPEPVLRTEAHEDGSGDLGGLLDLVGGQVDLANPKIEYEDSPALRESPEEVQKALSLEFSRNRDVVEYIKKRLIERVQERRFEMDSLCVGIAWLTVGIRNDQELLSTLHNRPTGRKKNSHRSNSLWRRVSRRRVLLRTLRERDYKKFEWLLEELNIVYKPRPFIHEDIQRRFHQSRLTELWCDEYRTHQMRIYKQKLDQQKPEFLRQKLQDLKWIMEEERELGVEPTVSQSDLEETQQRLEEAEWNLLEDTVEEVEYHIFDPESSTDRKYV